MDWYYDEQTDMWVCPVEDDASRKILAMIETKSPTVEASIAVIVDHGPQFYANKRDKNGHADHRFERYCRETAQVSKS